MATYDFSVGDTVAWDGLFSVVTGQVTYVGIYSHHVRRGDNGVECIVTVDRLRPATEADTAAMHQHAIDCNEEKLKIRQLAEQKKTLAQWAAETRIHPTVPTTETAAVSVCIDPMHPQRWELYQDRKSVV